MPKDRGRVGMTWWWKQQLLGASRTGGISWKIMNNMKTGKVGKTQKNNIFFTNLFFSSELCYLFHDFSTDAACPTPTNNCFHNQVIPAPDKLGLVYQTFTELDMMYSDFVVWPQAAYSAVHQKWCSPNFPLLPSQHGCCSTWSKLWCATIEAFNSSCGAFIKFTRKGS